MNLHRLKEDWYDEYKSDGSEREVWEPDEELCELWRKWGEENLPKTVFLKRRNEEVSADWFPCFCDCFFPTNVGGLEDARYSVTFVNCLDDFVSYYADTHKNIGKRSTARNLPGLRRFGIEWESDDGSKFWNMEWMDNESQKLQENYKDGKAPLIGDCRQIGKRTGRNLPWADATEFAQSLGYYGRIDEFNGLPEESDFREISEEKFSKKVEWDRKTFKCLRGNSKRGDPDQNLFFLVGKDGEYYDGVYIFYNANNNVHYFFCLFD
jgi:hypothetical protein